MSVITQIQVQKLFVVALVIKVTSAFFGWYLEMPWTLGFVLPLAAMVLYIVLGYFRKESDVSDEKFADTCYYLGFIFTITSIIFSLFDLPNIGMRIQDIAVRFGAAMVSTVLGLGVRVYLVSFRQDINDAIRDAEDAVLDATRKFTEQLAIVLERLQDFESQVNTAAKSSVEKVNLEVEKLSRDHSTKLADFFTELTTQNQRAFMLALAEVRNSSRQIAESVDLYSNGMRSNIGSIEAKVLEFTGAVTERLKTTTFPDDYFSKHLEAPLIQLTESAGEISAQIKHASSGVADSSIVLNGALKKLRDKANSLDGSLEGVRKLTEQQQALFDSAQGQVNTLTALAESLSKLDSTLSNTLAGITTNIDAGQVLIDRVTASTADGAATREMLASSLVGVVEKLESNALATSALAGRIERETLGKADASAVLAEKLVANTDAAKVAVSTIVSRLEVNRSATESLITRLGENVAMSQRVVHRLDGIATSDAEAIGRIASLGQQADLVIGKVDAAINELHSMVNQLLKLDSAISAQSSEFGQIANQIRDIKVVVEMQPNDVSLTSMTPQISVSSPLGAPVTASIDSIERDRALFR